MEHARFPGYQLVTTALLPNEDGKPNPPPRWTLRRVLEILAGVATGIFLALVVVHRTPKSAAALPLTPSQPVTEKRFVPECRSQYPIFPYSTRTTEPTGGRSVILLTLLSPDCNEAVQAQQLDLESAGGLERTYSKYIQAIKCYRTALTMTSSYRSWLHQSAKSSPPWPRGRRRGLERSAAGVRDLQRISLPPDALSGEFTCQRVSIDSSYSPVSHCQQTRLIPTSVQ